MRALRALPMPPPGIRDRIADYVAAQARPKLIGIDSTHGFDVVWPNNVTAVLALLLPEQMTTALLQELERQVNTAHSDEVGRGFRATAVAGGLISYGASVEDGYRQAGI